MKLINSSSNEQIISRYTSSLRVYWIHTECDQNLSSKSEWESSDSDDDKIDSEIEMIASTSNTDSFDTQRMNDASEQILMSLKQICEIASTCCTRNIYWFYTERRFWQKNQNYHRRTQCYICHRSSKSFRNVRIFSY